MVALRGLDNNFSRLNTTIIIAQRSDYSNIVDDIDPVRLNGKKLQEIHDLYEEFSKWTSCKVVKLNVDDENLEREVAEVLSNLKM